MSRWPSSKAKQVYQALLKLGWSLKRTGGGSHRILRPDGWDDYLFAFHDSEEIGPVFLARRARATGLTVDDL